MFDDEISDLRVAPSFSSNSVVINKESDDNMSLFPDSVGINKDSNDYISLFSDPLVKLFTNFSPHTMSNAITHVKVHASEKVIDWGAFMNFVQLKVLKIPDGLEVIGNSAWNGCELLRSVIIPSTVQEIGMSAFWVKTY